jgi:hypothetical protein
MRKIPQLVCQHLENISGDVLEGYQDIIREYASRRQGVYALYHDDNLYYVGLASDLSSRLKAHLSDKHAGQWNRFSVYLTIGDKHLRELESLILHVVKPGPKGNSKTGKFARSEDLRARLDRDIKQRDREKRDHIFGKTDETIRAALPGPMPRLCPYVMKVFRLRGHSKGKTFHASVRDDGSIPLQGKVYPPPPPPLWRPRNTRSTVGYSGSTSAPQVTGCPWMNFADSCRAPSPRQSTPTRVIMRKGEDGMDTDSSATSRRK